MNVVVPFLYHGITSCDKLKLNSKKHGILQDQIHYPPSVPFTAIFVILRLLVRVRSLNQIPAGNLVPTFLWKPPGCKSCLIDWQVWRRGQQSLGGLVVLEGKGPWWDDEERGQAGFRVVVTCHKSLWQLIQIHVTTVTNPCDNIDKNNWHDEEGAMAASRVVVLPACCMATIRQPTTTWASPSLRQKSREKSPRKSIRD